MTSIEKLEEEIQFLRDANDYIDRLKTSNTELNCYINLLTDTITHSKESVPHDIIEMLNHRPQEKVMGVHIKQPPTTTSRELEEWNAAHNKTLKPVEWIGSPSTLLTDAQERKDIPIS